MGHRTVQLTNGVAEIRPDAVRYRREPVDVLRGAYHDVRTAENRPWRLCKAALSLFSVVTTLRFLPDGLRILEWLVSDALGVGPAVSWTIAGIALSVVLAAVYRWAISTTVPLSAVRRATVDETEGEVTLDCEDRGRFELGDGDLSLDPVSPSAVREMTSALRLRGVDVRTAE